MGRLPRAAICAGVLVAAACGDDDRPPGDAGAVDAGPATMDASPGDGAPAADAGSRIRVGATDGTVALAAAVDIDGAGFLVEAAHLAGGVGTVRIDGVDSDAFVYERIEWPEIGQTLYQTLSVSPGAIRVLWFYCADGAVTSIWVEGTDGLRLTSDGGSGTCTETATTDPMAVHAPAIDMPVPDLLDGWTVTGPALSIEPGASGWVDLGAQHLVVLPFDEVDCSAGSCTPGQSWYELHSLLWDPEAERVCFAIFYLLEDTGQVEVTYSITLPDLSDPAGTTDLEGSWTGP